MRRVRTPVALVLWIFIAALVVLGARPAQAASVGSRLGVDQRLSAGDWIESGGYRLAMQTDGNLVLYGPSGALWASYTNAANAYLKNQSDGNLVMYADNGSVVWASRTNGKGTGDLVMQDDGNAVLYGNGPTWATYTNGGANKMQASGVVAYARKQLGDRYVSGGNGPDAFDCSGLTQQAYASVGAGIARVTYDQRNQGRAVSRAELQPGDLIFYNNYGHVAIYVGNDEVIHALNASYPVKYNAVSYGDPISAYRRYV